MSELTYQDRVIQHSLMWVNGKPKHNHIDDECVSDFSCCYPELFTEDKNSRMKSHENLVKRLRHSPDQKNEFL